MKFHLSPLHSGGNEGDRPCCLRVTVYNLISVIFVIRSMLTCFDYLCTQVTAEAEWKLNVGLFHVQGLGHDPTTVGTETLGLLTVLN